MSARILIWALAAFLVFGALAFAALIAVVINAWRRQRREAARWAMDPVRRLRQ